METLNALFQTLVRFALSESVAEKVIVALASAALVAIIKYVVSKISELIYKIGNFSIAGDWIASFDTAGFDKKNVEICHFTQRKERVDVRIEQYSNLYSTKSRVFKAFGIFRTNELYLAYMPLTKNEGGGGTLALNVSVGIAHQVALKGVYLEIDREAKEFGYNRGSYVLRKVDFPMLVRLRILFRFRAFSSYQDAKNFYDEALSAAKVVN